MRGASFGQSKRSLLDKLIMKVRLRKIAPLIPEGSAILDLGCGYRGELLMSIPRARRRVGIDLSIASDTELELIEGRVDMSLPFPDKTFEIVTALAIIEHVDNPEMMLSEIQRVLQPGGKVLVTTPALVGKLPLEILARLGLISREEIMDHKRYYTRETLQRAMEQAGLKQVRVNHFGIMWLNLFAEGVR